MLEKFFQLRKHQTNPRTEFIAGLSTFLTMAYIIFVNPAILSETGMDREALVVVTCLIASISTIMMAMWPKVPIALAPGMGMNAFFAYSLVLHEGVSWEVGFGIVFLAGVIFLILSIFGAREKIIQSIPVSMIRAISAGIGLFLLFIGLQNLGIVKDHPSTLVTLGDFGPETGIGLAGLFLILFLFLRKVKGAILVGIIFAATLGGILGYVSWPEAWFTQKIDISPLFLKLDIAGAFKLSLLGPIFALLYMDLFDTVGTLVACSHEAGLAKKDGTIKSLKTMLTVDAIATMLSGIIGTSPTTSYIESATGIAEGGRTGLTSLVTGLFFLVALLFIPVISIVPVFATAPALIIVGVFMFKQVTHIPYGDYEESIPAILTLVTMPLTFSISTGMAFGFLTWGLMKVFAGKIAQVSLVMWIIIFLSLLSLIL